VKQANAADRRALAPGVVLIAIGVSAFLSRAFGWGGPGPILLAIGAAFFALSAVSRFRGPLLPAGVLLGLGAGFLLRGPLLSWLPNWASIILGLGLGFLLVAGIDAALGRRREPPPLIPGAILTAVALAAVVTGAPTFQRLLVELQALWPFALIGVGILLIVAAGRRSLGRG
jgi:hypothetical protein